MPLKDPEARKEYHRNYMRQRLETDPVFKLKHAKRVRRNSEIVREKLLELVAEFRKNGCSKCPEKEPVALAAHHIDPTKKKFSIAAVCGRRPVMPKRMVEELVKCVCLCHNCHAKLHAGLISL